MAKGTFQASDAGFKAMAVGSEIKDAVESIAEKAKGIAEGLSPIRTGEYATSFDVHSEVVELQTGFGSHPVIAGILENSSDHAAAVEWGNAHDHQAHRVLGRTLDSLNE